jgi:hypothetical protein
MAVKASPEGIRKMDEVVTQRELRRNEYAKMVTELDISARTIRKFVTGGEVKNFSQ